MEGKRYHKNNNIIYDLKDGKMLIIEYDDKGLLNFEIENLNWKRNGKGKEYDLIVNLIFEAEFLYNFKIKWKYNKWHLNPLIIEKKKIFRSYN